MKTLWMAFEFISAFRAPADLAALGLAGEQALTDPAAAVIESLLAAGTAKGPARVGDGDLEEGAASWVAAPVWTCGGSSL
jgi:hypothetical protein